MQGFDATDEVNEFRAKKGLPPFERDPGLVGAAIKISEERAAQHRAGHTQNDFSGLPAGVRADAAGVGSDHVICDAPWGWHSCCDSEPWKYGGAAITIGDDDLRYMQLFVRESSDERRPWRRRFAGDTLPHPLETECYGVPPLPTSGD